MNPRAWKALTNAVLSGLGGVERPLFAGASAYEFITHHQLKIDRIPFDFGPDGYPHMLEPYKDPARFLTMMAGAQSSKTALALARLGWLMAGGPDGSLWGSLNGWYFPDSKLAEAFSAARVAPFLRGNAELRPWVGRATMEGKGQDAVHARTLGPSRVYFLGAGGGSTESFPFRTVTLDEVRGMSYHAVQLIEERMSGQRQPWMTRMSTAKYPKSDIHLYFQRGDQRWFHTACKCPQGCILSQLGEDCILDLRTSTPQILNKVKHAFSHAGLPFLGIPRGEDERYAMYHAAYYCPRCGDIIPNPRRGWWEPDYPERWEHSYQLPQMLSPTFPAAGILEKLARTDGEPVNRQEVYNSVFGMPFMDASKQPVTEQDLINSVRGDIVWARHLPRKERLVAYPTIALGADVQAGYLVVVLKARMENGRNRTIHLAIIEGGADADPWYGLRRMMVEWQVQGAVVDAQPEANEARKFTMAFHGRAWMAYYKDVDVESAMIEWGDVSKEKKQRGEERLRHTVTINRTPALDWSLSRWRQGLNETPPPLGLVQELPVDREGQPVLAAWLHGGQRGYIPICRDLYWLHLQRVAFEDLRETVLKGAAQVQAVRQGKTVQRRAVHVGIDPHFAHASLYADVALSRLAQRRSPCPG